MTPGFVVIPGDKRPVTIEYAWIGRERNTTPLLVFLHEGLGALARGRDWPQSACDALGGRGHSVPSVDVLISELRAQARAGDLVVFMSNGGFDNAPRRFLTALG